VKRHPHLVPLSDDHHTALVLARHSRKTGAQATSPGDLAAAWQQVRARFEAELEPHFRVEEALLLPPLAALGEAALVERTRADHTRLRELVAAPAPASAERMVAFGKLLHAHVRFEERELFARAGELLNASTLEAIGRAALAARPGGRAARPG
jgi:hypothetical protein